MERSTGSKIRQGVRPYPRVRGRGHVSGSLQFFVIGSLQYDRFFARSDGEEAGKPDSVSLRIRS